MEQDKYQRIVKIIFKFLENKDKQIGNLEKKPEGEKHLTYRVTRVCITSDFSPETMQARIEQREIYIKC